MPYKSVHRKELTLLSPRLLWPPGDVCYQPNAACVVMTTEIFRSMTYQGSELLREVSWVVFDEVHYMQDRERGVVWEEVIIQMPKEVRMVFLSATLPNSLQFAEWVASVHHSPCHVVSTDYRPTPLVHYAFPQGGVGLHLVSKLTDRVWSVMKIAIKGGSQTHHLTLSSVMPSRAVGQRQRAVHQQEL